MVDRLGRVEFFATLPPGLFVVFAILLGFGAVCGDSPTSLSVWASLEPLAAQIEDRPSMALLLLFVTYLAGSLIRAIPVKGVEYLLGLGRARRTFPFTEEIRQFLTTANGYHEAEPRHGPGMALSKGELPIGVFNYWKNYLCCVDPAAFQVYESYEARSRMYAGMLWAGAVGLTAGAIVLVFEQPPRLGVEMLLYSGAVCTLFGSQLHGVRLTEALVLVSMYAIARSSSEGARGGARPPQPDAA